MCRCSASHSGTLEHLSLFFLGLDNVEKLVYEVCFKEYASTWVCLIFPSSSAWGYGFFRRKTTERALLVACQLRAAEHHALLPGDVSLQRGHVTPAGLIKGTVVTKRKK